MVLFLRITDKEICDSNLSQDVLQRILKLGFFIYKNEIPSVHELILANSMESKETITNKVREELEIEYQNLKDENIDLARRCAFSAEELSRVQKMLQDANTDCRRMSAKIDEMYKDIYKESVQNLKDIIKEKEKEIVLLKNTNSVKGQIGEGMLATALKRSFPDSCIEHVGKVAHVCDVHMTTTDGKKIIFESKYKGFIEKSDISKFQNDIETMTNKEDIMGAVFVSFLSKNIPGKGSIYFEIVSNCPVMYVAYEDSAEFDIFFHHHMQMFIKLCEVWRGNSKNDITLDNILAHLQTCCDYIQRNKKRLDDFKSKFNKYYTEVDADNKEIIENLLKVLKQEKSCKIKRDFSCDICDFKCKTKKTLMNHINTMHSS